MSRVLGWRGRGLSPETQHPELGGVDLLGRHPTMALLTRSLTPSLFLSRNRKVAGSLGESLENQKGDEKYFEKV